MAAAGVAGATRAEIPWLAAKSSSSRTTSRSSKTVDRVIAQIDVQPVQVLIEAVIVQVNLTKGMDLGVNFAVLDGAGKALAVMGDGAAINAAAGFTPASVLAAGGKLASGYAPSPATNGLKFGFVSNSTTGFITALETFGETKVLACPRLLVLNKQRAELHIGKQLGYQTSTVSQTSTTQTVNFMNVGTQLRLRPFISSDGMIRMEIHPERSTGALDGQRHPANGHLPGHVQHPDSRRGHDCHRRTVRQSTRRELDRAAVVEPVAHRGNSVPPHDDSHDEDGTDHDPHAAHLAAGVSPGSELPGPAAIAGTRAAGDAGAAGDRQRPAGALRGPAAAERHARSGHSPSREVG